MFALAESTARALAACGVSCGDKVAVFMENQPEFYGLLLGAELIGATLICRDGEDADYVNALQESRAEICIIQDYYTSEQEALFFGSSDALKKIILIDPFNFGIKESMPDYIIDSINAHYKKSSLRYGHGEKPSRGKIFLLREIR